jgi:hypothetical protein
MIDAVKESSEVRSLQVASFCRWDLFWGLADDAPMPVSLDVREQSLLYLWSQTSLLPILHRNGQATWELSRLMAECMQRASDLVERLARLLLDHFEMVGEAAVSRHLTLDEMVCRALYSFSDKKLIEVTRTEFVLTGRAGPALLSENG